MNAAICRDFNARCSARRKVRTGVGPGNAGRGPWNGLAALLGGVILGACLFAASEAHAYTSYRFSEGDNWEIKQNLPSFPHEARRFATGYSAVQYKFCMQGGTATSTLFQFNPPPARTISTNAAGITTRSRASAGSASRSSSLGSRWKTPSGKGMSISGSS